MKKIYMSPQMDVIELKNQQMLLAGSTTVPVGGEGDAGNAEAPEYEGLEFGEWRF